MTKITERGMIFNGEMVRAILDGRKTQTRRIMKIQPSDGFHPTHNGFDLDSKAHWYTPGVVDKNGYLQPAKKDVFGVADENEGYTCPFGAVGDRIWVRETWARYNIDQDSHDMAYRATTPEDWPKEGRWRPSIHMPRWASRILLEITDVRVERLNDISEEDARAEGIIDGGCLNCGEPEPCGCANPEPDATDAFAYLWQSIYGQENWNANPWVWVIEFKRIEGGGHETD
ncbi:hypothetical protein [Escherichia coli]|uniref:hypothetical protein n=1 Tax=Escherichia coli TaxID=562 RepID=UPI0007085212|nr:hypothetical protein [Escherichia coli]KQJ07405.1 hypothetical protein AM264_03340 [Escherichia coli]MCI5011554.1 hypothetical protein [Escherichia coli]